MDFGLLVLNCLIGMFFYHYENYDGLFGYFIPSKSKIFNNLR